MNMKGVIIKEAITTATKETSRLEVGIYGQTDTVMPPKPWTSFKWRAKYKTHQKKFRVDNVPFPNFWKFRQA